MGFLDKLKENIQDTATMAREGLGELQTKRELGQAYTELGRKAFERIDAGSLQATGLDAEVAKVRELKAQLEAEEREASAGGEPPAA